MVLLVAVLGLLFGIGLPAADVRAAPPPPTLAIVSPADHAVIGDGSPLVIVFAVENFNLTEPGTVGPGPTTNEGHVNVSVDGNLTAVVSQPTVVLALDSGTYQVQLRLVSSNGTPLTPDVSASITVTLTRGPAGGTPRIAITYWEILYPFPGDLWGDDITISFRISNFTLVPPGRRQSVPNEGRLRVLVDGLVFKDITTYEPAHFSDLPDGDHTVTMRLVDGAGQPLNPDASDSTRFRVEGEQKVAPIPDLSPYLLTAQLGLGAAIVGVLYVHDWRRKR
ncbi:MAG: hypothetical protein E6K05_01365 [Methanobacteriota archaeon]|nr:MAG: hypothetical protein E6K05_01365 [Euryarchaeota archaeon]